MAPNKPLLVLAILDLVEAGLVGMDGLVHKDAQLNLRFRSYSPICAPRRGNGIDLNLPFRHLASDGVYVHVGEGEQTVKLDPVLLAAMQGPTWRQEARKRVVAAYFPARGASGPLRGFRDACAVVWGAVRGPGGCPDLQIPAVPGPGCPVQSIDDLGLPLHVRLNGLPPHRVQVDLHAHRGRPPTLVLNPILRDGTRQQNWDLRRCSVVTNSSADVNSRATAEISNGAIYPR